MVERDSGWIQLYVENSQEAYDSIIQAFKIAENPNILLPVMVCLDAFFLSHTLENVKILPDAEIRKFVGNRAIPLVTGQNMAFRKDAAVEAGGFLINQISGEDTSIFLRIQKLGKIVHSNACVKVSMRRIRKWGLYKYLLFNIRNFINLIKYDKPLKDKYEPIRK